MLPILLSLGGVVVGAVLGFTFTQLDRRLEQRRARAALNADWAVTRWGQAEVRLTGPWTQELLITNIGNATALRPSFAVERGTVARPDEQAQLAPNDSELVTASGGKNLDRIIVNITWTRPDVAGAPKGRAAAARRYVVPRPSTPDQRHLR